MLNNKNKGFGFGGMPGFNHKKIGSLSNGDYDRDGVKNKIDCRPMNWKKQDNGEPNNEVLEILERKEIERKERIKEIKESNMADWEKKMALKATRSGTYGW